MNENWIATTNMKTYDKRLDYFCSCRLPGFDANKPDVCPTCGKPHHPAPDAEKAGSNG